MRIAVGCVLVVLSAAGVSAQEPRAPTEAEIAAYMALAQPGPEHARLAALAGTWDQDVTFAIAPGQRQKVAGVAENRMILGGRFLVSDSRATEAIMGQMIEATSIYGFDRRGETWTVIGLDTFGTYYVEAEGAAAADAQTIVMTGVETDPKTSHDERYDMTLKFIDADTYVTQIIFKLPDGTNHTAVDITHRRRK